MKLLQALSILNETALPMVDTEHGYARFTQNVPLDWLRGMEGNDQRRSPEEQAELENELRGGLREPIIIVVGKNSRTAKVGEGNHRVMAARKLGFDSIPARVIVGGEWGSEKRNQDRFDTDLIPQPKEYFPSDAAPSDVFRSLAVLNEASVNHRYPTKADLVWIKKKREEIRCEEGMGGQCGWVAEAIHNRYQQRKLASYPTLIRTGSALR